ncbi:NUDIX domain-containing protein [Paenibacillus lutrae]|uniref:NUDIX domain-containing protein n=1 Tax=Paenibacillus lutrae TaxID=2078573 RepID=A0A7X3JZD4_9BACL|nr:NUDIX domain-containing protein [Paenibacillus lutrae]MVO99947.1 NUDIX domain-containing protein [Paenibacillus lutrae]
MPMSEYYKDLRHTIGTQMIFSPSAAAVIRNEQDEILFQRPVSNTDTWSLPAGAIELGETPAEAIIREVWEETGLRVTPVKLLGVFGGKDFRFTYPDGNQVEYVILLFECVVDSGTLEAIDGESAELRYFSHSDMPELPIPYPKEIFIKTESERTFF